MQVDDYAEYLKALEDQGDGEQEELDPKALKLMKQLMKSLESNKEKKRKPVTCDFEFISLVISDSDPPEYRLTTSDGELTLSSLDLFGLVRFRRRYAEKLRRIPRTPEKRVEWEAVVNGWLTQATVESLGEEASRAGYVEALVEQTLRGLPEGEPSSAVDLLRGCWVRHDDAGGERCLVALLPLVSLVHARDGIASSTEVTRALRAMGASPTGKKRLPGSDTTVRAWDVPPALFYARVGENSENVLSKANQGRNNGTTEQNPWYDA